MEELSVRVLAHVPTPQLHESYNAVLHEEFASVSQTLGDVVAAFAKLQEVHDAVSKLQQSHDPSTDRRNNSARALADNSMVLQQQLQCQVEKLAAGMEVVPVERKRKRVDDDGRPAATVTKREGAESSPASESGSDDSDENSDVVEGSEAAWKALTATSGASLHEVKSEPCSARPEADTSPPAEVLKDSATHLLPIMRVVDKLSEVDQSFIIPEVLTVLIESVEEDVDATQQSEVMRSLKIVVEWLFHRRKFQLQYAELYHKYARVVESYADRLPIPEEQSKLKRLTKMLTSKIKTRGKIVSGDKPAGIIAAIQDAKEKKACSKVLSFQDTLLYRNRIKVPLHVLIALKKETADGGSKSFEDRLIKVFSKLFRWFSADVREPVQLLLYRMFLIAIRELVNQTRELSASVRVVELLEEMSEVVSDSSNSKRLANLRNRATEIGEEANRYQTQLIPPMVASKLTDAVRGLATEMVMGWKPYADATMRNCVKELKAVLLQAEASSEGKPTESFKLLLSGISRWRVDDPRAEVKKLPEYTTGSAIGPKTI
ncbi:hypothetical protein PF005_g8705 [Phytophthora fragariae]|uniref:Uncharacterized protein n=1 Tax=Phytophthora fragariae TaxID=53985 RepID=A0A6A3SL35_9STRA|nr:hypothetical protein PF003_g2608 [Phytophthora fragariae]KAE8940704.1 hypothetical protein PF009_g9494 [Phytophthora fragariae]KAE9118824.1 hypothetical protein PF010_g8080 [Phytophthora fragariae]KAE9119138.1 hypothetical protein PF007_g8660 [Phytophthora fragariae]KAE9147706.1 hypothetical protein PF006_g7639 [Phytophthora fragariae]